MEIAHYQNEFFTLRHTNYSTWILVGTARKQDHQSAFLQTMIQQPTQCVTAIISSKYRLVSLHQSLIFQPWNKEVRKKLAVIIAVKF